MKFAEPYWLLVGFAACAALIWLWRRYDRRQRAALAKFASSHLAAQLTASFSPVKQSWKRGFFFAAIACLCMALARPQAGFRWEELKRRGIEVMFAVDTSRSMLTPDVKPDRLTRAKLAVDDFASHLDGDGMGLIAFAGNAFLQCPITLDYDAFHDSLQALDTGIIPRGGTDISSAIREAQAALQNRPSKDKILVLLTDGEDLEGNAVETAKAAAKGGLKIYTVGVGSANGELIPIPPEQGGGFVKNADGQFVKSRLDEAGLKAIAAVTGGLYEPLGAEGQGLERIYQQALAPLTKHDLASRRQKVYIERYQWPLAASLAFLISSTLIGTRRRVAVKQRRTAPVAAPPRFAAATAAAVGLLLINPFSRAQASTPSPVAQYNEGTAAYKAGQYRQAIDAFQNSLTNKPAASAKRLAEQEDTYYDLGDALYRTGQKTEKSNPRQTIQAWEQAVKTYEAALQLRSADADAKYNRDFVQKKLDELKKQQQQKQQQQEQKQNEQQQKQTRQNQASQQQKKNNQEQKNQQQANNGSQPDQQKKPDQPGQQPKPANPAQQSGDQHKQEMAQNSEAQREPGQMTKEEARALLDSLKDEQRRLPAAPVARNTENNQPQDQPIKDW